MSDLHEMKPEDVRIKLESEGISVDEHEDESGTVVSTNDGDTGLYLAVGHEDRDTAYLLVLRLTGTAARLLAELERPSPKPPGTRTTEDAGGG